MKVIIPDCIIRNIWRRIYMLICHHRTFFPCKICRTFYPANTNDWMLYVIVTVYQRLAPRFLGYGQFWFPVHRGQTSLAGFPLYFVRFIHDAVETWSRIYKIVGECGYIFSFFSNKRISLLFKCFAPEQNWFYCAGKS